MSLESTSTEAYDRGGKRDEHFRRADSGEWHYRVAVAGGRVALTNGARLEVDEVFRGVFDLEGE